MKPNAVVIFLETAWLPLMAYCQVENFVTHTDLDFLGYRDGLIYWKANCSAVPAAQGHLRQIPSGDGAINTIFSTPAGCTTIVQMTTEVALDEDGYYYWLNAIGQVRRMRAGEGQQPLATSPEPAAIYLNGQVAVGGDYVFWVEEFGEFLESFKLYRTLKSGGGVVELVADYTADPPGRVLELLVRNDDSIVILTETGLLEHIEPFFIPFPQPGP